MLREAMRGPLTLVVTAVLAAYCRRPSRLGPMAMLRAVAPSPRTSQRTLNAWPCGPRGRGCANPEDAPLALGDLPRRRVALERPLDVVVERELVGAGGLRAAAPL